jgi:hypothetical protein
MAWRMTNSWNVHKPYLNISQIVNFSRLYKWGWRLRATEIRKFRSDNEDYDDYNDEDNDNEKLHSPSKSSGISKTTNRCRGSSCHGRGLRSNNVTESNDADLQEFGRDGTIRQLSDIGNKAPVSWYRRRCMLVFTNLHM